MQQLEDGHESHLSIRRRFLAYRAQSGSTSDSKLIRKAAVRQRMPMSPMDDVVEIPGIRRLSRS